MQWVEEGDRWRKMPWREEGSHVDSVGESEGGE